MENLDEMDDFPDRYQVPKLNKDQINDLNRPITPKELEALIDSLPTKQNKTKQNKTKQNKTKQKKRLRTEDPGGCCCHWQLVHRSSYWYPNILLQNYLLPEEYFLLLQASKEGWDSPVHSLLLY